MNPCRLLLPAVLLLLVGCSQPAPEVPDLDDPEELNRFGLTSLRGGQTDRAILAFEKALQHRPDYPEALHNLGMALLKKGEYPRAIAVLEKAAKLNPESPETLTLLGVAHQLSGDEDKAAAIFARASELSEKIEARTAPFAVQVAAEEDLGKAIALANRLSDRYQLEAKISRVAVNGQTFYRVRIEADSRAAAEKLAGRLRTKENLRTWIVRLD